METKFAQDVIEFTCSQSLPFKEQKRKANCVLVVENKSLPALVNMTKSKEKYYVLYVINTSGTSKDI